LPVAGEVFAFGAGAGFYAEAGLGFGAGALTSGFFTAAFFIWV
jgi:hypothetical protein